MFKQKMVALIPFPFRGEMLAVGEEFVPDNKEQASLLRTIGHAKNKPMVPYRTRQAAPQSRAVMTAASAETQTAQSP